MPVLVNPYTFATAGTSTPDAIFGGKLLAWYQRGTDIFTDAGTTHVASDGDLVEQWNDQSGNGYHLVRETVHANTGPITWRPGTTHGGEGTMEFNSGSGGVTTDTGWFKIPDALGSALNATPGGEMWLSYQMYGTSNDGQAGLCDMTASTDHHFFPYGGGAIFSTFGVTVRVDNIASSIMDDLAFHVWNERAYSGSYEAYLDSTQVQAPIGRTISFRTTNSVWGIDDSRTLHLNGYVSELAFVEPPFDSGERSAMLAYMQG